MSTQTEKIGLISDTHSFYDPQLDEIFKDCNEIWHAGDIGDKQVIERLEKICPVKAVFGNIDDKTIQNLYPEDLIFSKGNLKIMITHIAANPPKYNKRVKGLIVESKPDILVCGHSHILKVVPDKDHNLLFINPGAAGQHGFHRIRTVILMTISNTKVESMDVAELGFRGRA